MSDWIKILKAEIEEDKLNAVNANNDERLLSDSFNDQVQKVFSLIDIQLEKLVDALGDVVSSERTSHSYAIKISDRKFKATADKYYADNKLVMQIHFTKRKGKVAFGVYGVAKPTVVSGKIIWILRRSGKPDQELNLKEIDELLEEALSK